MSGVHNERNVFVSGPPPKLNPSNWDASVRAYEPLALSCGKN